MRLKPETVHYLAAPHDVHRFFTRTLPDLAALVLALGRVPEVDPFVLLDGEGWGARVLAFGTELILTIENASPFDTLRRLLTREKKAPG